MSKKDRKKDKKVKKGQKNKKLFKVTKGGKPKSKKDKKSNKKAKAPTKEKAEPAGSPNARDVAACVIDLAGPVSFPDLRNLVYLSYAWHLAWTGSVLFEDKMICSRHNVAIPSLSNCCAKGLIEKERTQGDPSNLTDEQRSSIAAVIVKYACRLGTNSIRYDVAGDGVWKAISMLEGDEAESYDVNPFEVYRVYANATNAADSVEGGIVWNVPGIAGPFTYIDPDYSMRSREIYDKASKMGLEIRKMTENEYAGIIEEQIKRAQPALEVLSFDKANRKLDEESAA